VISNIDEIKGAIQITDILGDFLSLKARGTNFIACCPFHNEKTPSFIVNPSRGTFKCFGCGKSGDAIEFLRENEGMSYVEALQYIADRYKITVAQDGSVEVSEDDKRKEALFVVLKWAKEHFQSNLKKNKQAIAYIKERKHEKAVKLFEIGYAESGNDLLSSAAAVGFSTDLLAQAGLVKKNDNGHFYDAFSRRIIYPFFDRSGRVIGFTGRLLSGEDAKDRPKYLNSPTTELFKKDKVFYGIYQSKKQIIKRSETILVEGQTDLISLHLAGIGNVLAGSGTALSEDQVKIIRSMSGRLTYVYDNDPAGIAAAVKNIKIPLQLGLEVYILVLPTGEDPDSMVKKIGGEAMKAYIETNSINIVTFRVDLIKEEVAKDPLKKAHLVKDLTSQICLIPDEQFRDILLGEMIRLLELNRDDLLKHVKKQLPDPDKKQEKGFYGLDVSKAAIKEQDCVVILKDPKVVFARHVDGKENVIAIPDGPLRMDDIRELSTLTKNVMIENMDLVIDDEDKETPLATVGRMLAEKGLSVQVSVGHEEYPDSIDDFLDYYVKGLCYRLAISPDSKRSKLFVEMVAEFLSKLDNTIITIKTNDIAKKFGFTATAFGKILRPFTEKLKSIAIQQKEHFSIDDQQYVFDIAHLPDYVDQAFFQRYGFFPAQNKTAQKIFYVFRTLDNTLQKVGNFYLEPLFHIHDEDPAKNKRIVKLFHSELNKEEYFEFKSSDMIELALFKKFLWNKGPYMFNNGKQFHHEKILESIALELPKCKEFQYFGWQKEGEFFAFSNGIVADSAFTPVDELGLIRYKKETYYSPAFSVIYRDLSSDNDKYEYDRYLSYNPSCETSWGEWIKLMKDSYTYNDNGMWAILFTMLSAHRSMIFQIERYFTSLFFIGPTESGKSRIAESIRAPFMYGAPLFNLNSGTDAAFFTMLERFMDIPVIAEEYNDTQISDTKFQGLKAAIYDNEGKQKRKDATSKDIHISKINGSLIVLGQEAPERDDGALGNRVVLLPVPKKDDWTDQEVVIHRELKDREKAGLSNIAVEIINRRKVIQLHFAKYMYEYQKKVKEDIRKEGGSYQTRIINTVTLFIAMAKVWEDHVRELPMPFTFDQFYQVAKRQIIRQSEELSSTNRLSAFFNTVAMLYSKGQIVSGREFSIETESNVTVQISKSETDNIHWEGEYRRVLYLLVNDLIMEYQKFHGTESLKINSLRIFMKDHPAFIGQVKSHRFEWEYEEWAEDNFSGSVKKVISKGERNTSCIAFDYEKIAAMGIDLVKKKTDSFAEKIPASQDLFADQKKEVLLEPSVPDEF